jgi:glutamate/tyrosine decarboxylase-like PLP-dependent enzyme
MGGTVEILALRTRVRADTRFLAFHAVGGVWTEINTNPLATVQKLSDNNLSTNYILFQVHIHDEPGATEDEPELAALLSTLFGSCSIRSQRKKLCGSEAASEGEGNTAVA